MGGEEWKDDHTWEAVWSRYVRVETSNIYIKCNKPVLNYDCHHFCSGMTNTTAVTSQVTTPMDYYYYLTGAIHLMYHSKCNKPVLNYDCPVVYYISYS